MGDSWSKDFVEHLRTVHFAMVTLCITLAVIAYSAKRFDYFKIRDQLSKLEQLKDPLHTIWGYQHPVGFPENTFAGSDDLTNCEKLIGRAAHLSQIEKASEEQKQREEREHDCKAFYLKALVIKIDGHEFGVDIDPAKAITINGFVDGRPDTDLTRLNNFEPFWKHFTQEGFQAQTFGQLASLKLTLIPEKNKDETANEKNKDGTVGINETNKDKCDEKNQNKIEIDETNKDTYKSSIMIDPKRAIPSIKRINLTLNPALENMKAGQIVQLHGSERFDKYTVCVSFQSLASFLRISPSNLKLFPGGPQETFPASMTDSDFSTVFRELMWFVKFHSLENADLSEIPKQLNTDLGTNGSPAVIAGISVPLNVITPWGAMLLVGIQLYFWIHLHELANRIQPDDSGWNVAWIGIYDYDLARSIFALSACVIPTTTILILGFAEIKRYYGLMDQAETTLLLVVIPASAFLARLTYEQMERLHRNRGIPRYKIQSPDKCAGASG